MSKKALGKGLSALIGAPAKTSAPTISSETAKTASGELVQKISIGSIKPSSNQPRKDFLEQDLDELANSIRTSGVLQPLIVRKNSSNQYEIIAGERRWRAAQKVGLKTLPVIVKEASDQQMLEWAMIENLQRSDLNPIEEAEGYAQLIERFHLTQEQVAQQVGKGRASVANALRLKNLPRKVQDLIRKDFLSVGHAKVILGLDDSGQQETVAEQIIKKSLSVRQTEQLVASLQKTSPSAKKKVVRSADNPNWRDVELRLQRILGTKVRMVGTKDKGHLEIDYYQSADLERILDQLGIHSNDA